MVSRVVREPIDRNHGLQVNLTIAPSVETRDSPRTLLFSQRHLVDPIFARCVLHEFESLVEQIDAVDVIAPQPATLHHARKRFAKTLAYRSPLRANPGVAPVVVDRDYDLFLAVVGFPSDLLNLCAVRDWRSRCRQAVCWIDELLVSQCINLECLRLLLRDFDHIFVSTRQGVELCSKVTGIPCSFLPVGVDALTFCPLPSNPPRCIDVLSVGRRWGELHRHFLALLRQGESFYHFTSSGDFALDLSEHRLLLANMCKRSRFFLVHPGKMDLPSLVGGEELIGSRFFEGAAAGTIMLGSAPKSEDFGSLFHWPDAVVRLPNDAEAVTDVMNELTRDSGRQHTIRTANIVNSLRSHDWAHRLCAILRAAGLQPHANTLARLNTLEELASVADEALVT